MTSYLCSFLVGIVQKTAEPLAIDQSRRLRIS